VHLLAGLCQRTGLALGRVAVSARNKRDPAAGQASFGHRPLSRQFRVRRRPGLHEAFAQNRSGGEFVADLGQLRVRSANG
jgi:hypothetical protein